MLKRFCMATLIVSIVIIAALAGAQDKVVITIASGTVGMEKQLIDEAAAMYMKEHPDVEVKSLETPELATDRLGLYLQFFQAQSSEVDVYQIDVIWPGDLAEHLVDLNQMRAAFHSGIRESVVAFQRDHAADAAFFHIGGGRRNAAEEITGQRPGEHGADDQRDAQRNQQHAFYAHEKS